MTWEEWTPIYDKLAKGRDKKPAPEQCAAFFEVLQHYSEGLIKQAILRWNALNKFFPQASDLRELAQGVIAGHTYTPPECAECGGNGWIDAPDQQHFNLTYTNFVRRCPVCKPSLRAEVA